MFSDQVLMKVVRAVAMYVRLTSFLVSMVMMHTWHFSESRRAPLKFW